MCGLWIAHCTLQNITILWFFILFFLVSSFLRSFVLLAGAFLFVDFANYKISWQWTSMRMNSAEITTNVKRKIVLPCVSLCSKYQHTNVCLSFFLCFFVVCLCSQICLNQQNFCAFDPKRTFIIRLKPVFVVFFFKAWIITLLYLAVEYTLNKVIVLWISVCSSFAVCSERMKCDVFMLYFYYCSCL